MSFIKKLNALFNKKEHDFNSNTKVSIENQSDFKEIQVPILQGLQIQSLSTCATLQPKNEFIAYFKNGELYNVKPRNRKISLDEDRQTAYDARYIVSDGITYDLEDYKSIDSMKIPNFNKLKGMPFLTRDLGYIMKMKANKEDRCELAIHLVYKAANLMIASPIQWQKKDYYQIIKHLWLIGEIEYADYLLEELNKRKVFVECLPKNNFSDYFNNSSPYYGSDLIESNDADYVCPECAKYVKRWFSEFGYNKKYPKLPNYFKENREEHKYCNIAFHPVLDEVSIPAWDYNGNFVEFCNRPFIDNRTSEQKKNFEEHKSYRIEKEIAEERYFSRDYWIGEYRKHFEYQKIVELLGDKAPKSYSGYMRMKKNNTMNYQKIVKMAEENNIKIN